MPFLSSQFLCIYQPNYYFHWNRSFVSSFLLQRSLSQPLLHVSSVLHWPCLSDHLPSWTVKRVRGLWNRGIRVVITVKKKLTTRNGPFEGDSISSTSKGDFWRPLLFLSPLLFASTSLGMTLAVSKHLGTYDFLFLSFRDPPARSQAIPWILVNAL